MLALAALTACERDPGVTQPAPAPSPAPPPAPLSAPTIASVTPPEGLAGLSMEIRITGAGFLPGATVQMGGLSSGLVLNGGTLIRLSTPIHDPAVVDVTVTNPDGQSATLPQGYAYRTVTLSTSSREASGGSVVTVMWVAPGRANPDFEGDWVGLFKQDTSDKGPFIWGQYSTGVSGSFAVALPADAGEYEFRYLAGDDHIAPSVVMARAAVTVR
jgi:hypothetical protein